MGSLGIDFICIFDGGRGGFFVFLMGGGVDLEESLEESFSYWATVCTFRECLEINLTNVSTCTYMCSTRHVQGLRTVQNCSIILI